MARLAGAAQRTLPEARSCPWVGTGCSEQAQPPQPRHKDTSWQSKPRDSAGAVDVLDATALSPLEMHLYSTWHPMSG